MHHVLLVYFVYVDDSPIPYAMSFAVRLSEADGVPVARKSVLGGAAGASEQLGLEAANLASIKHPGIVRLLNWDGDSLVTEFAGRPVRQIVTVPTEFAARIVASLAHTVADLHDAGLVHTAIDESHVLVGRGEHPQLCSLGLLSPATPSLESEDVAGLGQILRHLVGDVGDGDPIPERRSLFRVRNRAQQYERRGLLTIADQATADVPGHRPTARRFAQMVADTVPSAKVSRPYGGAIGQPQHLRAPTHDSPDEDPEDLGSAANVKDTATDTTDLPFPHPALADLVVPDSPAALFDAPAARPAEAPQSGAPTSAPEDEPPWPGDEKRSQTSAPPSTPNRRPRSIVAAFAAVVGVAMVGVGIVGFTGHDDGQLSASADHPATTTVAPSTSTTRHEPTPDPALRTNVTTTTTAAECGTAGAPDLDRNGCGDELAVDGSIVRVGEVRFQVGRPDDVVTLGDWDCDGIVTPALLRPATGDVFVFANWTESEAAVQPLGHVESATQISPDTDALGCHLLVVTDTQGRRTTIDTR